MIRKNRQRRFRKLTSFMLALAVTASLMPASPAFAEDAEFIAGDEGTEVLLSSAEDGEQYLDTEAEITDVDIAPGDVTEGADSSIEEFDVDVVLDPDMPVSLEEDGIFQEDEAVIMQETETELSDVSLEEMAEESVDNAAGEEILDGGNVEHLDCPALLEQIMGTRSDEGAQEGSDGELESAGLVEAYNAAAASHIHGDYVIAPSNYSIDVSQSGNTVTVRGTISSSCSFYSGLYVDGAAVASLSGRTINVTFDISKYMYTGYHTAWMLITDGKNVDMIGRRYIVCNTITAAPTYNGVFNVYSNYFDYYPYNVGFSNRAGNLYMEYSADGGKTWARSGYMICNLIKLAIEQGYAISGLQPKTQYLTRIRYGTTATYSSDNAGDGKSYFFGGPVLNTTTIKTGAATKPKVKSVTAKAIKIKYRKIRWPSHYTAVGGMVFYHKAYTERFYTCKVKVTVKLKKKPGTKGVWITVYDHNGLSYKKWVKGNKKKYSVTITPVYNYFKKRPPKHYKFTVSVCSGQSKEWGGYSPTYSKRKKLS